MKNIIIDTDPGHDDALAIILMVKSGLFNILALTTVAGNSIIKNVTRNAAYILDLLGRRDIPVFAGREKPLKRSLISANVHGSSGLDGVDTSKIKFTVSHDAPKHIIRLVNDHAGNITLLALGPLSNIARAFLKDPTLPLKISKIIMMGGAIDVPGNKNRVAEFNMFADPEAADIVFKSKVKKILIPIDACNNISLLMSEFEKLKGSKLYHPIKSMMYKFIVGIEKYEGTKGALVYDAIAAYCLLNSRAFTSQSMDIVIETKGRYTRGMTVAEKRISAKKMYNTEVIVKVDKERFVTDLLDILRK